MGKTDENNKPGSTSTDNDFSKDCFSEEKAVILLQQRKQETLFESKIGI